MTPNTPLIVSGTTTTRTLPAERVFVQFALMRMPPSAQFWGTCWALPVVAQPTNGGALLAVTSADLSHIRALLVGAGILPADITARLVRAPVVLGRSPTGVATVGQVLIEVRPPTRASLESLGRQLRTLSAVTDTGHKDQTLWLHAANFVVSRAWCDALADARYAADRDATDAAQRFGERIGLRVVEEVNSERSIPRPGDHEYVTSPESVCGDVPATLPVDTDGILDDLMFGLKSVAVPDWSATFLEAGVYRADGVPDVAVPLVPGGLALSATPGQLDRALARVARSVDVPLNVPFVSAHGAFRASVRADAMLVVFYPRVEGAEATRSILEALRVARVPSIDIMLPPHDPTSMRSDSIDVRISPVTSGRLASVVDAVPKASLLDLAIIPVVADCASLLGAVAGGALHNASVRADAMTSAASASLESLIGVADAGTGTDAACGADPTASAAGLVRTLSWSQPERMNLFDRRSVADGVNVQFESEVVAAWRMTGAVQKSYQSIDLANIGVSPLSLDALAFASISPGVLADASRPLAVVQPAVRCEAEQLAALGDAVRVGHAKIKGEPVRALIEYSQNLYDPGGLCWPLSSPSRLTRGLGSTPPTINEQVLVVP